MLACCHKLLGASNQLQHGQASALGEQSADGHSRTSSLLPGLEHATAVTNKQPERARLQHPPASCTSPNEAFIDIRAQLCHGVDSSC